MRANRTTRIGIALLLVGLFLWALYAFFQKLSFSPETSGSANNAPTNTAVTPVVATSGQYAKLMVDVPERSIITPGMIKMFDRPSTLPAGNFILDPETQAFGFITRGSLRAGNPLRKTDLVGHITEVGIGAALQRPDQRAMILPISNKMAFHPMVRIGDHIDIIAAFDGQESRIIVDDVRVLAVDVMGHNNPDAPIAQRGGTKAPAKAGSQPAPAAVNAQGTPVPPGTPGAVPAATPPPAAAPPPAVPSLTLEVTAVQANTISLAQASGGVIDYLIRPLALVTPRTGTGGIPIIEPGEETRIADASVIRSQIAPYAERNKGKKGVAGGDNREKLVRDFISESEKARQQGYKVNVSGDPIIPMPNGGWGTGPIRPVDPNSLVTKPDTYKIPIYADGKLMREDVVRDPSP